jgi:protein phosphatase
MPDPQVLYIVTAVVVLGLVAWVIIVFAKGEKPDERPSVLQREAPAEGSLDAIDARADTPARKPESKSGPVASQPAKHEIHDTAADIPSVAAEVHVDVEEEEEPTGPNALILVTAVGRTDPGLKRKHNEDAYTILENHHLFVIADGMGRHAAGEVASQLCVEAIGEVFNKGHFKGTDPALPKRANRIRSAILTANDRILKASQENDAYAGMGTTVVAAYFSPNNQRVYIAHVGDSRCYRVRSGKLVQITTDHTLGAAGITGKSAAVLSRAVGVEESVEVDVAMESPLPGDIYLLCSDGLSRMVSDDEISGSINANEDLDAVTKKLIDMANERGGRDNITAILVRVEDIKKGLAA